MIMENLLVFKYNETVENKEEVNFNSENEGTFLQRRSGCNIP